MLRLTVLLLAASASLSAAPPCITAKSECTEWVTLSGGPGRSLIYRSHSLDARNDRIVRATIVIHGQGRNADDYFRSAVAAGFLAGALDDTVIVSPRFASADGRGCQDKLDENEISWRCSGDSWRSGAVAATGSQANSYDFIDEVLRKLANKKTFPNLKNIVVTGHSAGGQYVGRYAMVNQVHDSLGVSVSYVISNPSSYAYPDANRPNADASEFRAYSEGRNCTTFNKWPYGMDDRTGAAASLSVDDMNRNIAARPVTFLLGELDIMPIAGFDSSCPAMAQGPTRLARGQAYAKYINQKFNVSHKVEVVPLCGHNARCIYTADPALRLLFP